MELLDGISSCSVESPGCINVKCYWSGNISSKYQTCSTEYVGRTLSQIARRLVFFFFLELKEVNYIMNKHKLKNICIGMYSCVPYDSQSLSSYINELPVSKASFCSRNVTCAMRTSDPFVV